MRPGPAKVVLVFAALFLAGAAVGSLVTLRVVKNTPRDRPPSGENIPPQLLRRFVETLDLTEAQTAKLKPIIEGFGEQLRTIRREAFRETAVVNERMFAAVEAELTAGQRTKLDGMRAEQKARFERWTKERERRELGPDRPGEGPRGPGEGRRGEHPRGGPETPPPPPPPAP